jgi:DNA-binding beta-propeller fold protein YncE
MHGMLATAAVGLAWSLFAPAVDARLAPPAEGPPLVTRLVDAMHYQRPESVLLAMWMIAGIAVSASVVVGLVSSMGASQRRAAALCVAAIVLVGCSNTASGTANEPELPRVPFAAVIGGPGTAPGRFVTPRAANAGHGELLVIDRSGRLQRISDSGTQVVELPLVGRGYPTGVVRAPDGTVFIADTHGGRILRVQGNRTVDVFAGTGVPDAAQFVTPSDVALLSDGRVVVSVYGGDDHVAVLRADGTLERTIGGSGEAVGAFRRPQALAVDAAGMVWVADACNHRLQLLDPDTGKVLQVVNAGGAMRYPYGLAVLPGGDLLVAEYGGHVLRRLAPDGSRTRVWGGWGDGPGQLRTPWSVSIDEDARVAYLVDSGHDRVLRIELEALAW